MQLAHAVSVVTLIVTVACNRPSSVADSTNQESATPVIPHVHASLPDDPDPSAHWLIYLHGAILERGDRRPSHPRFGVYEFDEVLESFADADFEVIGEQRGTHLRPDEDANRTVAEIERLLAAGVPARNIAVVGFSKGGALATLVSDQLGRDDVSFVFLATCSSWSSKTPPPSPRGRLLAIREASDELTASCDPVTALAPAGSVTRNMVVEIGGGHGAFYRPHDAWVRPVVAWLRAENDNGRPDPPT